MVAQHVAQPTERMYENKYILELWSHCIVNYIQGVHFITLTHEVN